jgi:hypothetical protein
MLTPRIAFCKAVLDDCTQSGAHLHQPLIRRVRKALSLALDALGRTCIGGQADN